MDSETKLIYELKAEIIQAAAHPIRVAIIEYLSQGEQCVSEITEHVSGQRTNVSRHLALLLKAGIVESRKEGLKVIYSLKTPCILKFLTCVESVLSKKMEGNAALLTKLKK